MAHRPLSLWIAEVGPDGLGSVNHGDERSDARSWPEFASGWRRTAVPWAGGVALGLVHPDSGVAVAELDDLARPVQASDGDIETIARWERDGQIDLATLGSAELVSLVLDRWSDEGTPPVDAFHALPWGEVERLADAVVGQFRGDPPGGTIFLGSSFACTGSRFSAALEQLDEGLRAADVGLTRQGATTLCRRLLSVQPARLPGDASWELVRVAEEIRRFDRFLAPWAEQVMGHLYGADTIPDHPGVLQTTLEPSGDASNTTRRTTKRLARGPFSCNFTLTGEGRVEFDVKAEPADADPSFLAAAYGVMLLPVWILDETGRTSYHLVLRLGKRGLYGTLDLPLSGGESIEADLAGPPIGSADAALLPADEIIRSIRALTSTQLRREWLRIGRSLRAAHPHRDLIDQAVADRS